MDSSSDIILYNPGNGETFQSNEEIIKRVADEINEILEKNGMITDEEIIEIFKGET